MDKVEELLVKGCRQWTVDEWEWAGKFLRAGGSSELLEAEIEKGFELMKVRSSAERHAE